MDILNSLTALSAARRSISPSLTGVFPAATCRFQNLVPNPDDNKFSKVEDTDWVMKASIYHMTHRAVVWS
jgi:hypothetical protein